MKEKLVRFPSDTVILREGDCSDDMFKIIKGKAEVYVGYETPTESILGILGEQSCFGEFGLLLKKPAIYTVKAYSDVLALRITEGDMGDFVQENHKNILEIMRNMAESMMTMRLQIEMLLKEIESGKRPDNDDLKNRIRSAKQLMRQYAIYKPAVEGKPEVNQFNRYVDRKA